MIHLDDGRIGVLIVDDSAVVRATLTRVLQSADDIEVLDTAGDPYIAAEKMKRRRPDVIVLDIEMPRMDGLTFLRRIMQQHPIPVVICSAFVGSGSENAIRALEYGAVELITKPQAIGGAALLAEARDEIVEAVRAAAAARVEHRALVGRDISPAYSADAVIPRLPRGSSGRRRGEPVVVMGASTGGTEALRTVMEALPAETPPVIIVQHMPQHFTGVFAKRLDSYSALAVSEAVDGEDILPGHAYVAEGGKHVLLARGAKGLRLSVSDAPPVNRHRPSVDVLFRSAAQLVGHAAIGVLMTGMGEDGAEGLLEMRDAGAHTIAQDEDSSVVWGMPGSAVARGAAVEVLPLESISQGVMRALARAR